MRIAIGIFILALLSGTFLGVRSHYIKQGEHNVQVRWDAEKAATVIAESEAQTKRLAENAKLQTKQAAEILKIREEVKSEKDRTAVAYANADRLRIRTQNTCPRSPAASEASGAGRSDDRTSETTALPEYLDRDLKALMKEADDMSTALRAAQAFIRDQGMAPASLSGSATP